jgi:hypothetical protein
MMLKYGLNQPLAAAALEKAVEKVLESRLSYWRYFLGRYDISGMPSYRPGYPESFRILTKVANSEIVLYH